jgi:uncharacterized protein YbjT (DUF2867 family)
MAASETVARVAVFGGSGFLGSEIAARLSAQGLAVRLAVRHPDTIPVDDANLTPVYADVRDETSVGLALEGCQAAVNAVGLYLERGAETFEAIHELGALNVAHQCAVLDIHRLIHISGIGADPRSPSSYVRARAKGELLVTDVFAATTILRPSVVFDPVDKFINLLADITRRSPVLPLFGSGETRLQPVFRGDVAEAVVRALRDSDTREKTYELGGPHVFTYRQLVEMVAAQANRRRLILPIPFPIWDILAATASLLPGQPLTRDQVTLMRTDNVVSKSALTLEDLGIDATALEDVLPDYDF